MKIEKSKTKAKEAEDVVELEKPEEPLIIAVDFITLFRIIFRIIILNT